MKHIRERQAPYELTCYVDSKNKMNKNSKRTDAVNRLVGCGGGGHAKCAKVLKSTSSEVYIKQGTGL